MKNDEVLDRVFHELSSILACNLGGVQKLGFRYLFDAGRSLEAKMAPRSDFCQFLTPPRPDFALFLIIFI